VSEAGTRGASIASAAARDLLRTAAVLREAVRIPADGGGRPAPGDAPPRAVPAT
jgi:hypothetical protein